MVVAVCPAICVPAAHTVVAMQLVWDTAGWYWPAVHAVHASASVELALVVARFFPAAHAMQLVVPVTG